MIKIAVTGNIAAGKSEVEQILSGYGYPVIDTDKITHLLLNNSKLVNNLIKKHFFNYDILDEQGKISRKKLGKIVFSNSILLKTLENIIHPLIIGEIYNFFDKNKKNKVAFVSIPLLYEAKLTYLFDKVLLIYTDDEIREKRLIEKRQYSEDEVKKRMSAQISQDEKVKLADFVVYNNSDLENLSFQLRNCLKHIFK